MLPENSIYFKTNEEWRNWLEKNSDKVKEMWLILYRKSTGKQSLRYDEMLETALCYGWIDSTIKKIDDECYMQKLTPRTNYKNWSESNKIRVRKLKEAGLIKDFEMQKIDFSLIESKEIKLNYELEN